MRKFWLISLALIIMAVLGTGTAVAQDNPAQAAADWLIATHQNEDGGYASFSAGAGQAPSDVGGTLDALLALAPAGVDVEPLLAYLKENGAALAEYAAGGGSFAGKAALALTAAGQNPRDFSGQDVVAILTGLVGEDGSIGTTTAFEQSFAIMGLALSGETVPETAVNWLAALQATEGELAGSWDDGFGTAGNPDTTAMAVLALTMANAQPEAAAAGTAFLLQTQLESGGWEYGPGFGENVNSTALAIQALSLRGQDVSGALAALLAWQSESGAFQADFGSGPFDDFFSTVQAIPALAAANRPVPVLLGPPEVAEPAATPEPEPTATSEPTAVPTEPPTEEPTELPPTATMAPEPTSVPQTVVPAPIAEEPAKNSNAGSGSNTAVIVGVIVAILAGGGFFVFRRQQG